MALDDIKAKILSDAEAKKDKLLDEAKKKKETILQDYIKRGEEYRGVQMEKAETEGTEQKRGIIIDARQKVKNSALAKKREIMTEITAETKSTFIKSKDYPELMKNLAIKAISSGDEEVIVSKDEKALDKKWLDSVNKAVKGKLTFSKEKGKFVGGIILQSGKTFVNITIDTLFTVMKDDIEKDFANILF